MIFFAAFQNWESGAASMQVLRQCCGLCFAPNTVSRFVRIFPRAALFFLVLHIVILIITGKKFSSVNINILTYSAPVYVFVNIHNKNSVPKLHCTFIDLLKQKKVCQKKVYVRLHGWWCISLFSCQSMHLYQLLLIVYAWKIKLSLELPFAPRFIVRCLGI